VIHRAACVWAATLLYDFQIVTEIAHTFMALLLCFIMLELVMERTRTHTLAAPAFVITSLAVLYGHFINLSMFQVQVCVCMHFFVCVSFFVVPLLCAVCVCILVPYEL